MRFLTVKIIHLVVWSRKPNEIHQWWSQSLLVGPSRPFCSPISDHYSTIAQHMCLCLCWSWARYRMTLFGSIKCTLCTSLCKSYNIKWVPEMQCAVWWVVPSKVCHSWKKVGKHCPRESLSKNHVAILTNVLTISSIRLKLTFNS